MIGLYYILIALSIGVSVCYDAYCPNETLINPCTCVNNCIECGGNEAIDLPRLFGRLSDDLEPNQKHFTLFHLSNTAINELTNNTFKDITFDEIFIEMAFNLSRIDVNAFNGCYNVTKVLDLFSNPKLSQTTDNSLFEVLSKFVNIEEIYLTDNNITEIPDNAFKPFNGLHKRLRLLSFEGKAIRKLGNNAFKHLDQLEYLDIKGTSIDYIPVNAFTFNVLTDKDLEIYLTDNEDMTLDSFAMGSLAHIGRPVYIDMSYTEGFHILFPYKERTHISYLNEKTFLSFFTTNALNEMNLNYRYIDCNDCRNHWLTRHENVWSRIEGLKCSNGRHFTDVTNFENCLTFIHKFIKYFNSIVEELLILFRFLIEEGDHHGHFIMNASNS